MLFRSARFVFNFLRTSFENDLNDQRILDNMSDIFNSGENYSHELQRHLETEQKKNRDLLIDICNEYLQNLSVSRNKKFILHENAVKRLLNYNGLWRELKTILEKAAQFAENVQTGNKFNIEIKPNYLDFSKQKKTFETNRTPRHSQAIELLDNLEQAAEKLLENNIRVNGTNLGNTLQKKITAAAISEALKKHRKSIIQLFSQYPERWKLLRNEFRAVRKMEEIELKSIKNS